MVKTWERSRIELLINLIQQHNSIFCIKSTEYLDRTKKALAFNDILQEMKKVDDTLTIDEIKRKWKNLRTQFTQELRAIKLSKTCGAGIKDIYEPKLWCFQQLRFLENHTESRISIDNIKEEKSVEFSTDENELTFSSNNAAEYSNEDPLKEKREFTSDENEFCGPSSSQSRYIYEEPPKKKQKKTNEVNELRNDIYDFKNILKKVKTEKKFAWLGALVVESMEKIPPEDQEDAAWQVQCLMRKLVKNNGRKQNTSTSSSCKDIFELSMQGISNISLSFATSDAVLVKHPK